MFPEAKPRETLRSRGNKTHCFPRGQSLSVLLYLPTQNRTNYTQIKIICLTSAGVQICRRFKGARPDHVWVESSSCCCPRASWSFVRPRASWSFDQWHVTRSPPIRKRIWVGRYNKNGCNMILALLSTLHNFWQVRTSWKYVVSYEMNADWRNLYFICCIMYHKLQLWMELFEISNERLFIDLKHALQFLEAWGCNVSWNSSMSIFHFPESGIQVQQNSHSIFLHLFSCLEKRFTRRSKILI